MSAVSLIVIAKNPLPGRAKTRLSPPFAPGDAARLAEASLRDTIEVVMSVPAAEHVLALDGAPDRWRRAGLRIIPQRGADLAERLEHAFADVGGPALLVGMDTPQLTVELVREGMDALAHFDAVLGPADDGGYWSVGLNRPRERSFRGIPMSVSDTLVHQRARFAELGLRLFEQPVLTDVDTAVDARAVACLAPRSRFASVLAELS
jgi:hypothetical protein